MTIYKLRNISTNRTFDDTGWLLDDPQADGASLIRADYAKKQITVGPCEEGIYRFADWLPIKRTLEGSASPVTYRSEALAAELGLKNLYITFNGWFPERGAHMTTCSFKETEAFSVCGRMGEDFNRILVVASAGNTARAFAKVCSLNKIPLLLCVPEDNLDALWFDEELDDCVKLIASCHGSDYFDAIHLSNIAVTSSRFIAEGGAKNIARRDGMATTMLSAAHTIGAIPDYYFQAIGSGTGAIAAVEANMRLLEDGRFGNTRIKLMLSQNAPFLPMFEAWRADSRELLPLDDDLARRQVEVIDAKVLSNRRPPYAIPGGLFDCLKWSGGDIIDVTNEEAAEAARLFERLEGIDIHPASAVATASLIKSCHAIDKEAIVMLNITGGGEKRMKEGKRLHHLKPSKVFGINPDPREVLDFVETLF